MIEKILSQKPKTRKIFLSVIIPAFNQEKTIKKDLLRIEKTLAPLKNSFEIILVVDGFLDKTFQNAKQISSRKIKVIGYKNNHGKGHAVRYGFAHAKGNRIAFIDAGMDLHPQGLLTLLHIMEDNNADIIIGSKL